MEDFDIVEERLESMRKEGYRVPDEVMDMESEFENLKESYKELKEEYTTYRNRPWWERLFG